MKVSSISFFVYEKYRKKQLLELTDIFDDNNAKEIIEKVKDVCSNWINYSKSAGVHAQSTKLINKLNDENLGNYAGSKNILYET